MRYNGYDANGLFGWKEKIRRKKMKRRENEKKSIFSLYVVQWRENGKKKNESCINICSITNCNKMK